MGKEYEYIQTCDCESCIHKPICRILEGKEKLKTEIETFIFNTLRRDSFIVAEPLSININCKYYTNTVNHPYVNYRGEIENLNISTTAESTKVEKRGI